MQTFIIRRREAWKDPQELEAVAARSKQIGDEEMSDDVRWIRTYVLDDDGTLGSLCVYQATSPEALLEHAKRVDMPADEITLVADTVVVRPDPEPAQASS
jgi:Protein of unknown function (DUF4242)